MELEKNPVFEEIISGLMEQQYAVVDHFFTMAEVKELRGHLLSAYEEDQFKKAAIGNRTNEVIAKSIRGDFILWINESQAGPAEKAFLNKINNLVTYLNRTCFLGILQKEFHFTVYPKGTCYKRHLDTFQNDDRRKLSLVCYLNEEHWLPENGGELVLYLNHKGRESEEIIYPLAGRIVLFESQDIEHEVKTVQKERFSITGWLKTR